MKYEQYRAWLTAALETYRDMPPEARQRRFVDRLVEQSRSAATGAEEKALHNLVVLEYITGTKRSKMAICRALHMGRSAYQQDKQRAIERLCVLAFGIDGIDWA